MKIRAFVETDADALKALWHTVLPDSSPHNQPDVVLAAKLAVDNLIFVAESESRLVGTAMAGYDGHRGWLYSVGVLPELRRHGVGALLVKRALAELAALGCAKVNLQVRAGNEAVTAFYEALGFEVEPRISMGLRLPPP